MSDPDFSEFPEPEASLAQELYDMNKPSSEDLSTIDNAIEDEVEAEEAKSKAIEEVAKRARSMTEAIQNYINSKFDLEDDSGGGD